MGFEHVQRLDAEMFDHRAPRPLEPVVVQVPGKRTLVEPRHSQWDQVPDELAVPGRRTAVTSGPTPVTADSSLYSGAVSTATAARSNDDGRGQCILDDAVKSSILKAFLAGHRGS
ncbi:MAG: hypothetical protein E6J90_14190 [Deltaproteobacteria bacterium]|nr:MAG: hypothetical protein E6J90_14190 [Deltaproteobacteria bacterium]